MNLRKIFEEQNTHGTVSREICAFLKRLTFYVS